MNSKKGIGWKLTLTLLVSLMMGGGILILVLARGLADPPYDGLINLDLHESGSVSPPFTLVTTAPAFDISCDANTLRFQVRLDGYFSVSRAVVNWQPFIHITLERNLMYLHVDMNGNGTFRINDEIAWTGTLPATQCTFQRISRT